MRIGKGGPNRFREQLRGHPFSPILAPPPIHLSSEVVRRSVLTGSGSAVRVPNIPGRVDPRPRRRCVDGADVSGHVVPTASAPVAPARAAFSRRRSPHAVQQPPGRRPPPRLGARSDHPQARTPGGPAIARGLPGRQARRGRDGLRYARQARLGRLVPRHRHDPESGQRVDHRHVPGRRLRLAQDGHQPRIGPPRRGDRPGRARGGGLVPVRRVLQPAADAALGSGGEAAGLHQPPGRPRGEGGRVGRGEQ